MYHKKSLQGTLRLVIRCASDANRYVFLGFDNQQLAAAHKTSRVRLICSRKKPLERSFIFRWSNRDFLYLYIQSILEFLIAKLLGI